MLTPDEFVARFAGWFDAPVEVLTGNPTERSQAAAAKALHAEILKSNSQWFRALASRKAGTVGNWTTLALYLAAVVRQMSNAMGAANVVQPDGASGPEQQQGGGEWPPKV